MTTAAQPLSQPYRFHDLNWLGLFLQSAHAEIEKSDGPRRLKKALQEICLARAGYGDA